VGMTTLLFGMQFLPSYSCAYGEKEMLKASMIKREREWVYGPIFSKPYFSGALLPLNPMSLYFQIFDLFFLVLDLLGVVSCILMYLGCGLARRMNFLYLYKKKKLIEW
jgi:hypothetical protein